VLLEEVLEESGLFVKVGGTGTSNLKTDLNSAVDFTLDKRLFHLNLYFVMMRTFSIMSTCISPQVSNSV
jgi:hypothetical protein